MATHFPQLNSELTEKLYNRYQQYWKEEFFAPDTSRKLAARIQKEVSSQKKPVINFQPDKFYWNEPEEIIPLAQTNYQEWRSLDNHLNIFDCTGGIMLLVPDIWQLRYSFQKTIRKHSLYSVGETLKNIPLCTEYIRQAEISSVVTYPRGAKMLAGELKKRNLEKQILFMMIIGEASDFLTTNLKKELLTLLPNAVILFDLQIFPGHTIAYQSVTLLQSENKFHLNNEYLWESHLNQTYISGIASSVFPLLHYPVNFRHTGVSDLINEAVFELSL
ncbi:MAG: hypothetical protein ACI92I_000444 [Acidimicrobiales bacterium]|jgi:hypothetical protein